MISLIKFFAINIIILISFNTKANEENKILFSIKDQIITSIDFKNRIKYQQLLNFQINIDKKNVLDDMISVLLFNENFKDLKKELNTNEVNKFYKTIFDKFNILSEDNNLKKIYNTLNKENKIQNIKYDLQRKIIIEELIKKNSKSLIEDNINNLDINDYLIEYVSINKNNNILIEDILILIDFQNIENSLKELDNNKIQYIYKKKKVIYFEKLDKEIQKAIKNNQENFIINNKKNIIKGRIDKEFKILKNLKITLVQIITEKKIHKDKLKCDKINDFLKNNYIEIKEHKLINYEEVNEQIKSKLNQINDFYYIKNNKNNKNNYLILCEIKYDKNQAREININLKIQDMAKKIEDEFIKNKKIKYNFVLNNE